jgi:hypothetical protein
VAPWPRWNGTIGWAFLFDINDHRCGAPAILSDYLIAA